jgi:hypothetical protein
MVVSRVNRFTEFWVLSVEDIKATKSIWFCVLTTKNHETWEDILGWIREFIFNELGINIPDGLKIEKDYLKHIFDNHWYDTELNIWTSVTNEGITKIPDILNSYDFIEYSWFEDDWKIYNRFHMTKSYWSDTYHLVVQVQDSWKIINQLWSITFYINDIITEPKYIEAKQKWILKRLRAQAKEEYWDRFYD